MDKKNNYIRFRHSINLWLNLLEQFKKDAEEVLRDGAIDLTEYKFGRGLYMFYSIKKVLTPKQAYLDKDGSISIKAEKVINSGKEIESFVLSWQDMSQDTITLSDFMDCIYDNKDLHYDTEMERDLQYAGGPCELLGQAKQILTFLSEASADNEDHQDIVNFLLKASDETSEWMRVKELVFDDKNPKDWDDAVETVWPVNTKKEKKEGDEHKQIADILPVYDELHKELRELMTKALIQDILAISPSGKLDLSDFNEYAGQCDPANVYVEVNNDAEIQREVVETLSVTDDGIEIETPHGRTMDRFILLDELRRIYDEVHFIAEKKDEPDWWFSVKDGAVIFKN